MLKGARFEDALVSPSTEVAGEVVRSVLSPGVVVEAGAVVRDSVLLHDVVVRSGATVDRAVVDAGSEVAAGAQVGEQGGDVVLVGSGQQVTGRLAAGEHLPAKDRSA